MKRICSLLFLTFAGGSPAFSQNTVTEGSPVPVWEQRVGSPDQPLTNPIAAWDFYGIPSASPPATCTATIFAANLNTSNLITRGAGAPASGAANSFRTTGFQNNGIATTNTDYYEVTLGASPGYTLSLSTLDARFGGTGSFYASPGVTSQYAYSLDGINFTLIGSPVTTTSLTPAQTDLTAIAALQNVASGTVVSIRYYASGQTTTGGWGFYSSAAGNYGLAIGGSVNSLASTGIFTWNQTGTGNWNEPSNWTPQRINPMSTDNLIFDNGGSCTITGVPAQSVGSLKITGNTSIVLQSEGAIVLTVAGSAGTDLEVGSGSTLSLGGVNSIHLTLGTGTTASVHGTITFASGITAANRFTANDPGSILFHNGSVFNSGPNQSGSPFGTSATTTVIFESGSTFLHQSGSNPFGASQPGSAIQFQAGSLYKVTGNVALSFSGRTYANFELDVPGVTLTATGSGAVSLDHLTLTNGTLNFNVTGNPGHSIKGNIHAAPGTSLVFNPASSGTVRLSGTVNQVISGSGTITSGTHSILEIANGNGITLSTSLTLDGGLKLTQGTMVLGSGDLILGVLSQVSGNPSAASMVAFSGTGRFKKRFSVASAFLFPVGDMTGTPEYSPATITLGESAFGPESWIGIGVVNAKYPEDPNTANFLNRYWDLTASGITPILISAQFQYLPADVTGIESQLSCVRVAPTPYSLYAPADTLQHQLNAAGVTSAGIFTGTMVSPSVFQVGGSGIYCEGGSGLPVTLSGSQLFITYRLKKNGMDSGLPVEGTGSALTWPDQTTGIYTVTATNSSGSVQMNGSAIIDLSVAVTPMVVIESSASQVCAGMPVTFTALPTNGGINPVYQWFLNNSPTGQNSPGYTYLPGDNDHISCTMTSNAGCVSENPAYSDTLTITVDSLLSAAVSITASDTMVCAGNPVTLTATPVNGGPDPAFQWVVNNLNTGTGGSAYTYYPGDHDLVYCVMTSSLACVTCNPAQSNPVLLHVNPLIPVNTVITASETGVCAGTPVTFTATPTNGGSQPQYQWRVNGMTVGPNDPQFTYIPLNGDQITCELTSNLNCVSGNPALSNTITMAVNPVLQAGITIQSSATAVCEGSYVEFTAIPTNGGTQPIYQWQVNGLNAGTNAPVFSCLPANGDVVSCNLTSNLACTTGSPATSNAVVLTVNPFIPVGVSISGSANSICQGSQVTFTAEPLNGGNVPVYQWKVNGINSGSNNAVFIYVPSNGEVITCDMIPDAVCPSSNPAQSNALAMAVQQPVPVNVSISALQTNLCPGSEAVFHATASNGGSQPAFQWLVNGVPSGSNNPDFSYFPSDNDLVSCILTSGLPCTSGNPSTSNQITLQVSPAATVSVSIAASVNPVLSGTQVIFTAIPEHGGSSPVFQWKVNGVNAGINQPVFAYVPVNNDVITCTLFSDEPCVAGNPAISNEVVMMVNCAIPMSLNISGVIGAGIDSIYRASQWITVAGDQNPLIVQNGGQVTMLTGRTILYRPGTRVETGGYLHGDIIPAMILCGAQQPALMSSVNPEQEQTTRNGNFKVYPNPTGSGFTLEITGKRPEGRILSEIRRLDGSGCLKADLTEAVSHEYDLTGLTPGLYLLKVISEKSTETIKIIKY